MCTIEECDALRAQESHFGSAVNGSTRISRSNGPAQVTASASRRRAFGTALAERTLYDGAVFLRREPVPVTAKLSKLFYERFGEEIANELVEWFNQVDTTSRAQLRELNDINYARFEAKLEQRLAEFSMRIEHRLGEFGERLENRFEKRFDQQTRLFVLAWVSLLAAVIGTGMR
jgi:hypothetical protein